MTTVRARVTVTPEPHTAMVDLPLVSSETLTAEYVASELLERGITRNCEVVALLRDVPAGADVRKLTGSYGWLVADNSGIGAVCYGRVLVINEGYRTSLWEEDLRVAVWLRELVGESVMGDLAYATEDK